MLRVTGPRGMADGPACAQALHETVGVVAQLVGDGADEVTVPQLALALGLDRTAAYRRARAAVEPGYLVNREDKRGKPGRYVLGDPLPDEAELLPTVADLAVSGCTVAAVREGAHPADFSDADFEETIL